MLCAKSIRSIEPIKGLIVTPLVTRAEHGSPHGVYHCIALRGAELPLESHAYQERIIADGRVQIRIDGVIYTLFDTQELTIAPGIAHQVVDDPEEAGPCSYYSILTPDHDDPSLAREEVTL